MTKKKSIKAEIKRKGALGCGGENELGREGECGEERDQERELKGAE